MTFPFWMLIVVLVVAAFSIRVLDDLPGLIVVSLVASSLAGQPLGTWIAAAIALAIAYATNHVILTMCVGVAAYGGLVWFGL